MYSPAFSDGLATVLVNPLAAAVDSTVNLLRFAGSSESPPIIATK
jgi:hypothetical protein